MANLETLTIEINGNAKSASDGINTLIGSFRSLAKGIGTIVPAIRSLNSELKKLSHFSGIKIPAIGNGITSSANKQLADTKKATRLTVEQVRAWQEEQRALKPLTVTNNIGKNTMVSEEDFERVQQPYKTYHVPPKSVMDAFEESASGMRSKNDIVTYASTFNTASNQIASSVKNISTSSQTAVQSVSNVGTALQQTMPSANSATNALINVDTELKQKNKDGKAAEAGLKRASSGMNEVGNAARRASHHTSAFGGIFSRIGRIFSTMLMRTALRSIMKSFSEAFTAAYNFSKHMGGEFSIAVDKAKTLLAGTATRLVSTFAPAIQAIVPVLTVVASSINYLCQMIQWLFSLLGMTSDLFGASADSINKYAKAAGSGGSKTKEMLAAFDELNVISQESGGGGGVGGIASNFKFSDLIGNEIDAITSLLVNEGLIAVGLILACTGHIGIGAGLMSIGAAGIAKTIIEDWGKLSSNIQSEIANIMTIVGTSLLAIGAVLAFTGVNVPLGVGLMAVGALNLGAMAYLGFTGQLSNEIKAEITKITAIVGSALLAVGAILAFSGANVPLGIGLMVAGGLSLGTAVALNWEKVSGYIVGAFEFVKAAVKRCWDNIVALAQAAWNAICKIWEDTGIGQAVRTAWGAVSTFFKGLWEDVGEFAQYAWTKVSKWWHENVTKNVEAEGVWGGVKGFFKGLWDSVAHFADDAWNLVKVWWNNSNLKKWVEGTWDAIKKYFSDMWTAVTRYADDAWNLVKIWWNNSNLKKLVEGTWNGVKKWFSDMWTTITRSADDAWNLIKIWWEKSGLGDLVRGAWETVKNFFVDDLWKPISSAATDAWNLVSNWWNMTIYPWVSAVWNNVKSVLTSIWDSVTKPIKDAWNVVKNWWETNVYGNIKAAWENIKKIFEPIWNILKEIWDFIQKISGKTIKTTVETTVRTIQETVNVAKNATTKGTTENNLANIAIESAKSAGGVTGWIANLFGGLFKAEGGYGIPSGDLFVANEAGAELVGSINGKTSVANQDQIIEGIQRGVYEANSEQNALLRRQNELLQGILEKDASVRIGASAALGRVARQSLDMYSGMVGG